MAEQKIFPIIDGDAYGNFKKEIGHHYGMDSGMIKICLEEAMDLWIKTKRQFCFDVD